MSRVSLPPFLLLSLSLTLFFPASIQILRFMTWVVLNEYIRNEPNILKFVICVCIARDKKIILHKQTNQVSDNERERRKSCGCLTLSHGPAAAVSLMGLTSE